MTVFARQRFSEFGKNDQRHSGRSAGSDRSGRASAVCRFKSWVGSRTLSLLGVGGGDLYGALGSLEGGASARP